MKLSKLITAVAITTTALWIVSCGGEGVKKDEKPVDIQQLANKKDEKHTPEISESEITISNPLNTQWITAGKSIYEMKCQSCHRLTGEKLVGPGWKDVTKRRKPVWIMNMINNTDMMLDSDPEAQKLLELCMVRMPNQNLSKEEARQVIEFMRNNDGEK